MLLKINNSYNTNFRAIQLSAKEAERAENCIHKLLDLGITGKEQRIIKNDLFNRFNQHLQKEARHKTSVFHIYEDVLAEIYLKFSELLNDIKNNPSLELFLEKLNEYKPTKDTIKSEYIHPSLNTHIYWDNDLLENLDRITSDDLPIPKSSEYIEEITIKIKKAINKENLPKTVKKRILERLNGIKFKDIAKKSDINIGTAKRSVQKGILKVQHANGTLPKNFIEKAQTIADIFQCDIEKATKFILKNPAILGEKPETMMQKVRDISKLLNCPEEKIIKICLKYPDICLQRPETLMNKITRSAELLNCSKEAFIKAGLYLPPILCLKPETLLKNVQQASEYFNCSESDYVKAALRQVQLFCQKPETLNSNIENTTKLLECSRNELVKVALREPEIFCLKSETILRNVKEASNTLNCTKKEYIQIALCNPKLFFFRATTLLKKIKEISQSLGYSEYECMKLALDYPYLLYQNAKTTGEKLKIENYYRKIKNEEPKKVPCKISKEATYIKILVYLLQNSKIEGIENFVKVKQNFNMQEFTKTFADKTFSFEIPEDEVAEDFVKFVQNTSTDIIGKNIFEFKIKEKKTS